jgi:hypothetical protein
MAPVRCQTRLSSAFSCPDPRAAVLVGAACWGGIGRRRLVGILSSPAWHPRRGAISGYGSRFG